MATEIVKIKLHYLNIRIPLKPDKTRPETTAKLTESRIFNFIIQAFADPAKIGKLFPVKLKDKCKV